MRLVKSGCGSRTVSVDTRQHTRRLAPIVFTDIVGFSKLTEGDEVTALELLATLKRMANRPPIDPRVQMNLG